MADRSFLVRAGWTLVAIVLVYLVVDRLRTPAPGPPPVTNPVATTLAPPVQEPLVASAPPVSGVPASELSPTAQATPGATSSPQATATASTPPTPDPAEAQRKQQEEQRIRDELAAAKAKAESLSVAADTECPDLKAGELRHPGAVSHCARIRSEAAQAVSQYEAVKQRAVAAGINVQ